ncbi:VCBS domain-containing protein, partial [Vibrio sp. 10N.261.48.B3]|uniref:VCBS domain-containing protein n=1 Tax=Vibrio sp. 10N.261.48.B3 TaxID=3229665 RepID=UPI00354CD70A
SDADGDNAFNTTPVFKSIVSTDDSGNHPTTALGQFAINAAGKWTFNVDNNSALVQGLKEGESIVQVYEVTSKDGTAKQNVTITINGADDDSTITVTGDNDKGSVTEDTDVKAGDLLVTSGELS